MNRYIAPMNPVTGWLPFIFINKKAFAGTFILIAGTSFQASYFYVHLYMFMSRPLTILAHIIGWLLFAFLIVGFTATGNNNTAFTAVLFSPQCLLFLFTYMVIFYLNGYLLFPFLYLRKKHRIYFLIIAVLIALFYFLKPFDNLLGSRHPGENFLIEERSREQNDEHRPPFDRDGRERPPKENGRPLLPLNINEHGGRPMIDIVGIVLFIMTWSFSSAIQILKQWRATEQRVLRAEADRANAELSFLRAQINPHFLFNTLNNIYSLVVMKNDGGPQAIMKLSQMLRYVTDEATQDYVPLEMEVQCIRNYIDLQQLRLNKNMMIDFNVSVQMEGAKIPPLILMTFVENVFKYGISSHEQTVIIITIMAKQNRIHFYCRNKTFYQSFEEERQSIGINNAKKRLHFLYPEKHKLVIENENGWFTVMLDLITGTD